MIEKLNNISNEENALYTYIKRNINGFYVEFPNILKEEDFSNLGTTYQDFVDNKWVLLSKEQVEFHKEHSEASVKEVFNMELNTPPVYERTIEEAKQEKLSDIDSYDNSENVNSFTINNSVNAWLIVQERTNYKTSIDSAKLLGVESLSFYINDIIFTVSTDKAEKMLAAIQLYADACSIVTKQHKLAVSKLNTIEEVDNYDYTIGYPEKLNFDIE